MASVAVVVDVLGRYVFGVVSVCVLGLICVVGAVWSFCVCIWCWLMSGLRFWCLSGWMWGVEFFSV